ncbi:hypothetical protein TanjilG_22887 [Lupinus angustifolius]|uniref:Uncharacterized protein n=1 Tax=Lupinus angustifolius TaxID=3871 RepID=A0A4P1RI50_LUPAN|nr:PREDICTED: peroxisomal and mitochondrial division factor 1-like [Lupinus angustifolius]OIW11080.1 hypothetical protein TanjilG_22887 [Lupinus angustifolius]
MEIEEMENDVAVMMDVAELREALEERETMVEFLEREVKGMKQVNAEVDMKVRDLERKVGVLEVKEIEERSKRIRIEEELKDKVDDKKREIVGFKEKIKELEKKILLGKKSEMEKWMNEKMKLEEALRESEEKARSMESIIDRWLREEAGKPERVKRTMKEKVFGAFIRAVYGIHEEVKGVELQWPMVAAGSAAAIAVVIYMCFRKQR